MLEAHIHNKYVLVHDDTNVIYKCNTDTCDEHVATPDANSVELYDTALEVSDRITALGLIDLPED